jgi:hypothetical protein
MNRSQRRVVDFIVLSCFAVQGILATSCPGLEKTAVRVGDLDRPGDWNVSTTCQVAYYNYCTGWIWVWGGWSPINVVGVCYETCCGPGDLNWLNTTWERVYSSAPPGRGFTGTIDIWTADADQCPTALLARQPFYFYSGWNGHAWGALPVPERFVVTVTFSPAEWTPSRLASDHPAPGPTGPQACGLCYPLDRLTHSYEYGDASALLCPGEKPNDGTCDVEWLWDVALWCPIDVEYDSWASIKALYR